MAEAPGGQPGSDCGMMFADRMWAKPLRMLWKST